MIIGYELVLQKLDQGIDIHYRRHAAQGGHKRRLSTFQSQFRPPYVVSYRIGGRTTKVMYQASN